MSSDTRLCVSCGRSIAWEANVCPYCGHDYRVQMGPPPKPRSSKPVIAGVLIIIAGLAALAMGLFYMVLDVGTIEDSGVALPPEVTIEDIQSVLVVCGAVLIVFAAIAIVGGYFAIQRKHFFISVAGAVFGLLGIGFLLGALLALIGLILVAISRQEFEPS